MPPYGKPPLAGLAKISPPRPAAHVARPRLFALLDGFGDRAALWLSAPAGAGKTTLVASWRERTRQPTAWYAVDPRDAEPATFFYYLAQTAPTPQALPLLTPEYMLDLGTYARNFFERLFRETPPGHALVLDNYQEIGADSPVHDLVALACASLPAGRQVVILSRGAPPPAFARLRANRGLGVLGWDELRLTREEVRAIGRLHDAEAGAAEELYERSGGWAAGLVLLLGSDRPAGPGSADPGQGREALFDYFAAEVFDSRDDALKDFLLRTALLPQMTARSARALTGRDDAEALLSELANSGFFTTRRSESFDYHPLFRDFLLERGRKALTVSTLTLAKRSAAACLAEEGQYEAALELYQDLGDWPALMALTIAEAPRLLSQGRHRMVEQWLERLPAEVFESTPWAAYWRAMAQAAFNPAAAWRGLAASYDGFVGRKDAAGAYLAWAGVVYQLAVIHASGHELLSWIDSLDDLRRRFPDFPGEEVECQVAISMVMAGAAVAPWRADLEHWLGRALALSLSPGRLPMRMGALFHGSYLRLICGDWTGSAVLLHQLQELAAQNPHVPVLPICERMLSAVTYNVSTLPGDPFAAAQEGLEISRRTGVRIYDVMLLGSVAWAHVAAMRRPEAMAAIAEMRRHLMPGASWDQGFIHYLLATDHYLHGDMAAARTEIQRSLDCIAPTGEQVSTALATMLAARIAVENAEYDEAARQNAMLQLFVERTGNGHFAQQALLNDADIRLRTGDEEAALLPLRAALRHGADGLRQVAFPWRKESLARLCAMALRHGAEPDCVRDIIRIRNLAPPRDDADETWPWPVRIRTFGGLRVEIDGAPLSFPRKAQGRPLALLKLLLAQGGRDVHEDLLSGLLWPDADGDAAHQAFATTLHRLRRLVGHDALVLRDHKLSLAENRCWLDLWALDRALDRREARHALQLWRGAFLAGEAEDAWLCAARERLGRRVARLAEEAAGALAKAGDAAGALGIYSQAVEIAPEEERLHRGVIACLAALGRRAEADHAFERCARALKEASGGSPSAATAAILRGPAARGRA